MPGANKYVERDIDERHVTLGSGRGAFKCGTFSQLCGSHTD